MLPPDDIGCSYYVVVKLDENLLDVYRRLQQVSILFGAIGRGLDAREHIQVGMENGPVEYGYFSIPIQLVRPTEPTPQTVDCLIWIAHHKIIHWETMHYEKDEVPIEIESLVRQLDKA
jgi:hypothetical protein